MKNRMSKLSILLLAVGAFLGGTARVNAQALVQVDPSQDWIGYINVFELPADGGAYLFGYVIGTPLLQANFAGTNLTLNPCTYVWETLDTDWVKADGVTPAVNMDANFYVQDDTLVNTNVIFVGTCRSNTLTTSPEPYVTAYNNVNAYSPSNAYYTSQAFIKVYDSGYVLLASVSSNLVAGQAFSITLNTAVAGAAHAQYGFETIGPDQSTNYAFASSNVVIAVAGPSATVTVDPSQTWIGYMNVFDLPVSAGGDGNYQFGSSWGTTALQALLTPTNLTLLPDTNVWETTDTYWVKADGVTPNKIMDASMYVQNDTLVNTNLIFIGSCLSNTLTTTPEPRTGVSYTSVAFIKIFNGSFGLLNSVSSPGLAAGQPFAISLNTSGATHVQYGFETVGPDQSPVYPFAFSNVMIAAAIPPSPAPTLTNNAPTPARPQSSVLSLYNSSGVYTNHPVERWLASWSGAGESSYTIPATGRTVLKYSNLQYAGVEFYNNDPTLGAGGDNVGGATNFAINAGGYDTFHVDVWTPNANQFGIQLVSINPTAAAQVDFLPVSGTITNYGWVSLDIPLSQFSAANPATIFTNLQQLLWIDNEGGGGYTGGTFYIDNVYFYNSAAGVLPKITATLSGGNIQLSFPTQNGSNYTVQYKTNLTDAVWQTLTTVGGNGSAQIVPDPIQKSRFYRLYVH